MGSAYRTHSQRELKRCTGQVVLLITWAQHTGLTPKENWRWVQGRSSSYYIVTLYKTHSPPKENWRGVQYRLSLLLHGPLIQDSLPKRIEEGYRTGRPSYNMVPSYKSHSQRELKRGTGQFILLATWSPHTRLTPKENWRGVQDRSSFLSHGTLIQDSLQKRIEEGYRTGCPCYYMFPFPSYKPYSQKWPKRGKGYRTGRLSY